MLSPGLYVVATPIGNREDITLRALQTLAEADLVAAEDTRHSGALLAHHGISARFISLHDHNEEERIPGLLDALHEGKAVALVSDAGTPLVSDPGFRLVRAVVDAGLAVYTVPGASAVTAALSIAGLATDRFQFEGFLPSRSSTRRKRLEALRQAECTVILYESAHRVEESLGDMARILGEERRAVLCRELTKQFETVLRGKLGELHARVAADPNQRKGEFVILLEGASRPHVEVEGIALARTLLEFLPASQAARVAAKVTGGSRRDIYAQLDPDDPVGEKQ